METYSSRPRKRRSQNANAGQLSSHDQIELSDGELVRLSVRELNRLVTNLPPQQVRVIKYKRRTLKNRGYASNCRVRRLSQKDQLTLEKRQIVTDCQRLRQDNELLRKQLEEMKKRSRALIQYQAEHGGHGGHGGRGGQQAEQVGQLGEPGGQVPQGGQHEEHSGHQSEHAQEEGHGVRDGYQEFRNVGQEEGFQHEVFSHEGTNGLNQNGQFHTDAGQYHMNHNYHYNTIEGRVDSGILTSHNKIDYPNYSSLSVDNSYSSENCEMPPPELPALIHETCFDQLCD